MFYLVNMATAVWVLLGSQNQVENLRRQCIPQPLVFNIVACDQALLWRVGCRGGRRRWLNIIGGREKKFLFPSFPPPPHLHEREPLCCQSLQGHCDIKGSQGGGRVCMCGGGGGGGGGGEIVDCIQGGGLHVCEGNDYMLS